MALPRAKLGRDGAEITALGLGTWAMGGGGWSFGWGPQDDARSVAAVRHAVELGVNWIDTAAVYGHGHSEEVVGKAVRELPEAERPYVFTKCGLVWDESRPMKGTRGDLSPQSIRRECEASLRRLGLDHIDLYQFHWPDETGVPVEESWAAMSALADEGKVRWCGVSNFSVELLERCEAVRHVDSLQPPFSLIAREFASRELPWCRRHETGVIVYSPMHSGLLTTSFSVERIAAMADDDWRRRDDDFKEPRLSRNLTLRDLLRPIAERLGATVEAVAVRWVLEWEGVTGAIVGARSPEQVGGWMGAATLDLGEKDLDDIATAIIASQAGAGRERPRLGH
ncbi:MAG TPA: aldo/keto reductase [Thermoleophilia bacterium]|nr:aldo/keto reductase [Thermoleophilia bacterium]